MTLEYTHGSFDVLMMTKSILIAAVEELEREEKSQK